MANNGGSNEETLNAAANAISLASHRNQVSEQKRRWKGCWGGFWCFGSQKQGKRIVPDSRIPEGATPGNGPQQTDGGNQPTTLSPSLLAPPSSPASFVNSSNPSAVQSPAAFFPLSSISASVYSPGGPTSNMFATGPYAHETQLVSPPVFSTFNTEPSTAPITPPPELVHLTTPSSPEVPFAQLFTSSLDAKSAAKKNGLIFSSPFTSPRYVATNDLQATYQLYPGSPAGNLLSPTSGVSGSGASSPLPDLEFPARWSASHSVQDAFFPKYEPPKLLNLDRVPSRTFLLSQDSEASCFSTSAGFRLDQVKWTYQSHGQFEGEQYKPTPEADTCCNSSENMQQRQIETDTCGASIIDEAGKNSSNKSEMEQLEANRASFGLSVDEVSGASDRLPEVLRDSLSGSSLGKQNPYPGEFVASDESIGKTRMETAQLALLDHGSNYSSFDCLTQDIEAQARKDTDNGFVGSVALNSSLTQAKVHCSFDIAGGDLQVSDQGISRYSDNSEYQHILLEANKSYSCLISNSGHSVVKETVLSNDSEHCDQTVERVHSRCREFKFDRTDGTVDLSLNKEWWTKHKEKRTAESGVQSWGFFHMMQPGERAQFSMVVEEVKLIHQQG